ncbi:MAG: c-type cytochrome [Nitrospinota bacterium]
MRLPGTSEMDLPLAMRKPIKLGGIVLVALLAHSVEAEAAPRAPDSAKAFRHYCAACHGPGGRGDGPNAQFLDPPPRDLTRRRYMRRITKGQIRRVIRDGGAGTGRSAFMPPFGKTISAGLIDELASYVKAFSKREKMDLPREGRAQKGKRLVGELGCTGCHKIPGLPQQRVGPNLSNTGSKLRRRWLVEFLLSPKKIRPVGYIPLTASRMPDFRLGRIEAEALVEYLMSLKGNRPVPKRRLLTAGDPQKGADLFQKSGCGGCHRIGQRGGRLGPGISIASARLKPDWTVRWLLNPQAIDEKTMMPNFALKTSDARNLAAYIAGFTKSGGSPVRGALDRVKVQKGKKLFSNLGCWGCHRVDGFSSKGKKKTGPDLRSEGVRVQKRWLLSFLKAPYRIRPRLAGRMPNFRLTSAEAGAVATFLGTLKGPPLSSPVGDARPLDNSPKRLREARRLMGKKMLGCVSCHSWGSSRPEGDPNRWGPDLSKVNERLRPVWVAALLASPQRVQPGTDMPQYFPEEDELPREIAGGDRGRAIAMLRDLLMLPAKSLPRDVRR